MERKEFLQTVHGTKVVVISDEKNVAEKDKKFLSGGFYFLQEFFKHNIEALEEFQKILHYEEEHSKKNNDETIDLTDKYYLEIFLYDGFFKKFPSAKEELEYFTLEGDGFCGVGNFGDPDNPIWIVSSNDISWIFVVEIPDRDTIVDLKIFAVFTRMYKDEENHLATVSLKDEYDEEIFTVIYK